MAYQYNTYWDAYYRAEGDSIDSGVSHFNCGGYGCADESDVFTSVQLAEVTGIASASSSHVQASEPGPANSCHCY